ncbi:MAG: hypothetical protein AAGN35_03985 [Bacteroidota bacterium]
MARSNKYPPKKVLETVDFASEIYRHAGSSVFVTREDAAKALKKSVGYVKLFFSAGAQYGLFEVKVRAGYRTTALFKDIAKPLSDESKREALRKSVCLPPLYQKLFGKFDGERIPTVDLLANLLCRDEYGIQDNAATKAATLFLENVQELGMIDENGSLDVGAYFEVASETGPQIAEPNEDPEKKENDSISVEQQPTSVKLVAPTKVEQRGTEGKQLRILLGWDRFATISLPPNPKREEIDIITEDLQRLRDRLFPETKRPQ